MRRPSGCSTTRRFGSRGAGEAGRVAVLDLLRARTRRFEVVFVLGLEEGRLPRRAQSSPFLDEEQKAELERSSRSGRLLRTDPVSRDRYLFYTACTRPTRRLYLVREAATDEGSPREPSPFWDEAHDLFAADETERWTRRRPLAALTWQLEAAPSERERLRALASLASSERAPATALARANGWERRIERALGAFDRPTRLTHPAVLEELRQKGSFSVTDLERFADCSSMWFFERLISPRSIDAEVDAAPARHGRAPGALHLLQGPAEADRGGARAAGEPRRRAALRARVPGGRDEGARARRRARAGAQRARAEPRARPRGARPPRGRVRLAARSEPLRGLVRLGALGPGAPARPRPGRLHRLGQDRPDRPSTRSARAGSSSTTSRARQRTRRPRSSARSSCRSRSTCSSCATWSGSSRSAASTGRSPATARRAGSCAPRRARTACPGFQKNDYLDEDAFWGQVSQAEERARTAWRAIARATSSTTRRAAPVPDVVRASGRCAG